MSATTMQPSLRDRKKRQTRDTLIDTALEMFTERGFTEVTLDELCASALVSKRTFFRTFTSKEDVAMAPVHDLLLSFLRELETLDTDTRPLIEFSQDAIIRAINRTSDDTWTRRAILSCRLAQHHPTIDLHGLRFCQQATNDAHAILRARFALRRSDELPMRLAGDMITAAFRYALADWSARAPDSPLHQRTRHENLAKTFQRACAALPKTLTVGERSGR